MKVILPCCGRSSRYPGQPPKWMLEGHDRRPMITMAVADLGLDLDDLVVVILREHVERFDARSGIARAFGRDVHVEVLDAPTRSQAETVVRALERTGIDEPFLVKDSDNSFALDGLDSTSSYVSVDSLNNHDLINPRNKSYVRVDHNGSIVAIREKAVISDLFSVGGYFFTDPAEVRSYHDRLDRAGAPWDRELYLSDIIAAMLLDGIPFQARPVERYQDWGTLHEWQRRLATNRTVMVALDGFLFERGSQYFHPLYPDVAPHPAAVEAVAVARQAGRRVIALSVRPAALADLTRSQLEAVGLGDVDVVYDVPPTGWTMVTGPDPALPLRSGSALEALPDDPNLAAKLLDA